MVKQRYLATRVSENTYQRVKIHQIRTGLLLPELIEAALDYYLHAEELKTIAPGEEEAAIAEDQKKKGEAA